MPLHDKNGIIQSAAPRVLLNNVQTKWVYFLWKITSKRSEDAFFQNWTNFMSAALKFNEWAFNCIF